MRGQKPTEIDHIDPRWEEGRGYQLVCGLDCPLNYREENRIQNTVKSNRFLPWRWSRDEIGVVPTEPGDLAWFLVGEEWVLMEFLSDEWFALTSKTCGASQGGRVSGPKTYSALVNYYQENPEARRRHSLLGVEVTKEVFRQNPGEAYRRFSVGGKLKEYLQSEEHKKNCVAAGHASTKEKYRCLDTNKVSTFNGLTIYQRNRGIDTSRRVKLSPEEVSEYLSKRKRGA
jgi:hypothetical protein